MQVHSLWIYPVKSLAGIAVDQFGLDDFGPVGDRRWMIIDEERNFVTQRALPELARIRPAVSDGLVTIDIPGEGLFPLEVTNESLRALVWRDWVKAQVGGVAANEALSRFVGKPLRLVHMPDDSFRRVDAGRVTDMRRVSFADGFPLLVASLSSLHELNSRLESPVEMRRVPAKYCGGGCGALGRRWLDGSAGRKRPSQSGEALLPLCHDHSGSGYGYKGC